MALFGSSVQLVSQNPSVAPQPTFRTGVDLTLANLSSLKTNKARAIRFSTLDALCRELKCQPGDLLAWTPAEEGDETA